jgi:hypothetical protein
MTHLMIKCRNCGFEFPAPTQMNEEALMAINIENNNESCPKCKRTSAYNKSDYYFKESCKYSHTDFSNIYSGVEITTHLS